MCNRFFETDVTYELQLLLSGEAQDILLRNRDKITSVVTKSRAFLYTTKK